MEGNDSVWSSTYNDSYLTSETDSIAIGLMEGNDSVWSSTYNDTYLTAETDSNYFSNPLAYYNTSTIPAYLTAETDPLWSGNESTVMRNDGDTGTGGYNFTGDGVNIIQTATTGSALSVIRNLASGATDNSVVKITQDNAGDNQPALSIQQDGGYGVYIDHNGNAGAIYVDSESTSGYILRGYAPTSNYLIGLYNEEKGASTSYTWLNSASNAAGSNYFFRNLPSADTGGPVINIIQTNTGDNENALSIQQDGNGYAIKADKNFAGTGFGVIYFLQDSTTGGQPVLVLDQDDTSEGFIHFLGTDTGAVATSTGDSDASIIVELNGIKYKMPLFAVS